MQAPRLRVDILFESTADPDFSNPHLVVSMSSQALAQQSHHNGNALPQIPYHRASESGFYLEFKTDPPGRIEVPARRNTVVAIHTGPSLYISCRRDGYQYRGIAVHGDLYVTSAGTPTVWEMEEDDVYVALSVPPELLDFVAEESEFDPRQIEIRNRFQSRDSQLENIAWALKAEMECGYPCGRLYLDSLGIAVAARLLHCHSSLSREPRKLTGRIPERRLKQVLAYIEDNLSQDLSLGNIAASAGLSPSHFKVLFRDSLGMPVHQYVIRRRVERAKNLLAGGKMSMSQIANETGFAHRSHLARHMRRILGVSPTVLRELLR